MLKQQATNNLKNGIADKRDAKLINILLGLIAIVCFIFTLFLSRPIFFQRYLKNYGTDFSIQVGKYFSGTHTTLVVTVLVYWFLMLFCTQGLQKQNV